MALLDILARSAFTNDVELRAFERNFARYLGASYCIGVSSGLDAETIGLRALGLRPGDKVIAPAMTFAATVEAIRYAGGQPVLVDVDRSGLLDLNQTEDALKNGVRFVVPVHLFGQMVDPDALKSLADRHGALIFEDACQAHGARMRGRKAGTIGRAAAFSFYPAKNLGALGDGGALCTSDPAVLAMAKALREHGQTSKNVHAYEGYTARLDNLQAAFLDIKLKQLDIWTTQRIAAARHYDQAFTKLGNARPQASVFDGSHAYHLYVLLTPKRGELIARLESLKIGYGLHYPHTIAQAPCYRNEPWAQGSFPNAELFAAQGISLPIFSGITTHEQNTVIAAVSDVCD